MDALILSCGTGGGHNSAGKAVMEELKQRNHHVTMMNPYTLCSEGLAEKIDRLYISTASKAPGAFGVIYNAGEMYRKLPFRSPVYHVNQRMVSAMQAYLEEHHYDVVIMPHLFPAEIMTNMKRHGLKIPRTMFIATDYCCIPFTEETECDAYVIPSAELEEDFSGRGIPADRLYPYGIPVDSGFASERKQRRESVGTGSRAEKENADGCAWEIKSGESETGESETGDSAEGDKRYMLISGGSMGAGKIEKLIGMLLEHMAREEQRRNMGIIVICGNNQELYRKLKQKYGRQIVVVGHTDYMAEYLRVSSLYITKPGGLSSTEAAVCGVPLVHMPPIPGCETYNVRYFRDHNMSVACDVTEEGAERILSLLEQPELCRQMTDCQHKYIRKDAAVRICDLAERLAWGTEEQPEPVLRFRMGAGT